jgi:D-lactate dehydrogenase
MAPFVELEWGEKAYQYMKEIKEIFDPENILNPGVLLNSDKNIHLKNLKPLPVANDIIDKCIECGFCENICPSKAITFTPRQRIVAWREISRLISSDAPREKIEEMIYLFDYFGNQTCATDGLCSLSCPVDINTGVLVKELRSDKLVDSYKKLALVIANHLGLTTSIARFGLSTIHVFHSILGSRIFGSIMNLKRKLTFNKIPRWNKYIPDSNPHKLNDSISVNGYKKVVYFPSCISRTMGVSKDFKGEPQTVEMMSLLKKCGYNVVFPENLSELCCGMPFSSKGYTDQGNKKADELLNNLSRAAENDTLPILFDTSPCTYHIREYLQLNPSKFRNLKIYDTVEFIHKFILPEADIEKSSEPIVIHVTCSSKKMGLDSKFIEVAEACSDNVTIPEEVHCCGFAGDRGFTYPELNDSALVNLKKQIPANCVNGYSNSKTCEIGLSNSSGIDYQSIVYLVNKSIKTNKRHQEADFD